MDLEFDENWILVAGGSNGLGSAATSLLLAEGANVLAVSRRRIDVPVGSIGRLVTLQADLSTDRGQSGLGEVLATIGPLRGILATIGSGNPTPGGLVERFASSSQRNLVPVLRTLDASAEFIVRDERSAVVLVSSIAGIEYLPCPAEYAASKAALGALSGHLAREWAPTRVNLLAPGNMMSKDSVWERRAAQDPTALQNYLNSEVALKRIGSPAEVACVATFLLSPLARFMTGSTVVVDGGQSRQW